jgi:alpha-beta hydrolase superfamily lysophospholipase
VQTQYSLNNELHEEPGYFEVPGAHLYTVLHRATNPVARVLLVGPFAPERHHSYDPWVRWARYLAQRGVEVLRYDYRGVGESEGVFDEMSFAHWNEDVELLTGWLGARSPNLPLVLHGLEMGALLAARAFHRGIADVLFLWSPPENANQALRPALLRWIALDQLFKFGGDRRTASAFIRDVEQGATIDVEGYRWSPKLWRESQEVLLPREMEDEGRATRAYQRPVRIVRLGNDAIPLIKGGPAVADEPRDFTSLFAKNWERLAAALAARAGGSREADN